MQTHDSSSDSQFSWELKGRVVVLDNGGGFVELKNFHRLMELNSFATIVFDPSAKYKGREDLQSLEEFQLFSNVTLGDGSPVTMHACLEQAYSSTLEPKPNTWLTEEEKSKYRVLAKFPINSIALDTIEGLPSIDWLLLDEKNDNSSILNNGNKALDNALLIQVRVSFRDLYEGQVDMTKVCHWMSKCGYQFHCIINNEYRSHFSDQYGLVKEQATELLNADLVFVPSQEKLSRMEKERLTKLSFILHTVYGMHDLCYSALKRVDSEWAECYLIAEGYKWDIDNSDGFKMSYKYSPDIWG